MVFADTISFIFMKTQQCWDGFDAHFTDEEAEACRGGSLARVMEEGYKQIPLHHMWLRRGAGPDAWCPKWVLGTQCFL